ncbi:MAG: HIT domain-containing protein [Candidatus Nomurabacteria bacterium]|jgi:histidine triad (HIT) family protein|nr:HIT domain-containing protein [Candidatus Nomurabacteria bacterium]
MQDSIFTKIIKGEIPSHKVYEDDKVLAFLDIMPETAGHTLVIPKAQVDKFYDLQADDYEALFAAVKKIAAHMEQVLGQRTLVKIVGTDVPHTHIHLIPFDSNYDKNRVLTQADAADLAAMAKKLKM